MCLASVVFRLFCPFVFVVRVICFCGGSGWEGISLQCLLLSWHPLCRSSMALLRCGDKMSCTHCCGVRPANFVGVHRNGSLVAIAWGNESLQWRSRLSQAWLFSHGHGWDSDWRFHIWQSGSLGNDAFMIAGTWGMRQKVRRWLIAVISIVFDYGRQVCDECWVSRFSRKRWNWIQFWQLHCAKSACITRRDRLWLWEASVRWMQTFSQLQQLFWLSSSEGVAVP